MCHGRCMQLVLAVCGPKFIRIFNIEGFIVKCVPFIYFDGIFTKMLRKLRRISHNLTILIGLQNSVNVLWIRTGQLVKDVAMGLLTPLMLLLNVTVS